ncbi:histidine kinase dimerization/phosphoacceptor domain -containing protein [Rhizobium sp. Root1220]|uniref:sensor histidine kinase n=1 Tax=Rhizobium sp. Root1220 TaxID=1736432 RepID=UPI0006FE9165|nr:histidine kinase dimerization/phosphoacceptor domain -containing protein [Rhizobium sp. Root1220]KQV84011.1 two-component system sensor histidine kinase/response regulator [Rhizobium sp. Root1220]
MRILYVDDDPALARLATRVLARSDFEVVHAASIAIGLQLFEAEAFEAVVLDHYFENQTGLTFLEAIAELGRQTPVLYVTGSSDADVAIRALKGGAADYVVKTATDDFFPLLVSALHQALENARLRSEKEEADRQLVAAKERAELLLAEMNHRIANSLSLVSAMIRMQMQLASSEETKTALNETQNRITAIAGVHRSLYTSENVGEVQLHVYLGPLLAELESTNAAANGISLKPNLCGISTSADKAVALGVILIELVTNAMKYAYPAGAGDVRIELRSNDEGTAVLSVEDDGIGYSRATGPKGTGLGTRLINAMATTLGAEIVYGREGKSSGTHIAVRWRQ